MLTPIPKPFAWSYSHLKNYRTCPKRYYHTQVAKGGDKVTEKKTEALSWGDDVHKSLFEYIAKGTPLPVGMRQYQRIADKIKAAPGEPLTETQLAINAALQPVDWFAHDTWCRSIIDVGKIKPPHALILDWKTGKRTPDDLQLKIMGLVLFAYMPELTTIEVAFVWLRESGAVDSVTMNRDDIAEEWAEIMPLVERLRKAKENAEFPPLPGRLCKNYCPVKSCPYNGT